MMELDKYARIIAQLTRPLCVVVAGTVMYLGNGERVSCETQWRVTCPYLPADEPAPRTPSPWSPAPTASYLTASGSTASIAVNASGIIR